MAVGPITYSEIEAYDRLTHAQLTAWQVQLIRRLDIAERAKTTPGSGKGEVSARDGQAVTALFRGLAAGKKREAAND